MWVVPGSPYSRTPRRSFAAIATARVHEIPFLGTCGGFQHAILHLARDLAGIEGASHYTPPTPSTGPRARRT